MVAGRVAEVRLGWSVASALALVAAFCSTASASVKTADVKADRVALGAYKQFLGTVHSQASAARDAADTYVASISPGCPDALGPPASQSSVNTTAVEASERLASGSGRLTADAGVSSPDERRVTAPRDCAEQVRTAHRTECLVCAPERRALRPRARLNGRRGVRLIYD